jgi:hypothetical protein
MCHLKKIKHFIALIDPSPWPVPAGNLPEPAFHVPQPPTAHPRYPVIRSQVSFRIANGAAEYAGKSAGNKIDGVVKQDGQHQVPIIREGGLHRRCRLG